MFAGNATEIRERHIERFNKPDLHGALLTRIAVDNVVIDRELVTRTFLKEKVKSMCRIFMK